MLFPSGCTTLREYVRNGYKVGPQYAKPPAPVADDWIDTVDKRLIKDPDEHRRWWANFKDPNLDSLICMASQQNLTLREAGFRVLESRAKLAITVGEFFPQQQFANGSFTQHGLSRVTTPNGTMALAWRGNLISGADTDALSKLPATIWMHPSKTTTVPW